MLKSVYLALILIFINTCVTPPREEGVIEVQTSSEAAKLPLPDSFCQFSYQTQDEEGQCDALAVSKNFFLVTAHCVKNGIVSSKITCTGGEILLPVKVIAHEDYQGENKNDLALIKVLDNSSKRPLQLSSSVKETAELVARNQCHSTANALICTDSQNQWKLVGINAETSEEDTIRVHQSLDRLSNWIAAQQRKNTTGIVTDLSVTYEVDLSEMQVACTYKSGREYVLKDMIVAMNHSQDKLQIQFSYRLNDSSLFSVDTDSPKYPLVSQKATNGLLSELNRSSGKPSPQAVLKFINSGILQQFNDNAWWIKSCRLNNKP